MPDIFAKYGIPPAASDKLLEAINKNAQRQAIEVATERIKDPLSLAELPLDIQDYYKRLDALRQETDIFACPVYAVELRQDVKHGYVVYNTTLRMKDKWRFDEWGNKWIRTEGR